MSHSKPEDHDPQSLVSGRVDTSQLLLKWIEAPWDTSLFGYPVAQITAIEVRGAEASDDLAAFEETRDGCGIGLVSCRLDHDRLVESMLLEDHGFRFIEMVYQPELDRWPPPDAIPDSPLQVELAGDEDLPAVLDIAGHAFRSERFHIDPRLDPAIGDQRYRNWARSSLRHSSQQLYVIHDRSRPVAFFVTELQTDGTCYWHLTAVAPDAQGQGYGRRAWLAMLRLAQDQGATRVQTCIAARNHRVLNLYARLGFRFPPPLMTFHWVRPAS